MTAFASWQELYGPNFVAPRIISSRTAAICDSIVAGFECFCSSSIIEWSSYLWELRLERFSVVQLSNPEPRTEQDADALPPGKQ